MKTRIWTGLAFALMLGACDADEQELDVQQHETQQPGPMPADAPTDAAAPGAAHDSVPHAAPDSVPVTTSH